MGLLQRLGAKLLDVVRWMLDAWWRVVLGIAAAAGLFFWKKASSLSKSSRERGARSFPRELAAQRAAFFRLQKQLKREGYPKSKGETLREFALRIDATSLENRENIVAFLLDFERARYGDFDLGGER